MVTNKRMLEQLKTCHHTAEAARQRAAKLTRERDALRSKLEVTKRACKQRRVRHAQGLMRGDKTPLPLDVLTAVGMAFADELVVLDSAISSADDAAKMPVGELARHLRTLATEYRYCLITGGGDACGKECFPRDVFSANESKTARGNRRAVRERTFTYRGEPVRMFHHLKLGKNLRVHFHWDSEREVIVIGHCGDHRHLPNSGR